MGTCDTAGASGSASAGSADDHNNDNHDVHPPAMCRTGIHDGGSADAGSARSESERLFELIPQILATFAKTITGYGSMIKINDCVNAGKDLSFKLFKKQGFSYN